MFDSIQGNRVGILQHFASLMISLAVHVVVVCVFVLLPLIFLNVLPADELISFIYAPPPPPVEPPPPVPPRASRAATQTVIFSGPGIPPIEIPNGIPEPGNDTPDPVNIAGVVSAAGPVIRSGPGISGIITDLLNIEPPMAPKPPRPLPKPPIVVVSRMQESKLIIKVDPAYPELARISHVSGNVILQALIDEEGNVTDIKLLSGHPLLKDAAITAVKQWKYSPTILNGEPVSVQATVIVVFRFK